MTAAKWTNLNVVLDKMKKLTEELGKFPSSSDLIQQGFGGLRNAIYRHHHGMKHIRVLLNQELSSKPYAYYQDINNIIAHIEEATSFYGHFPSILELEKMFGGIKSGICKYHGGYRNLRSKLGFKQLSASPGYWHDIDNVKREVIHIASEVTGYFPSYMEIEMYGPRGLYTGIINTYGNLDESRKALGFPLSSKSKLERKVKRILNCWIKTTNYVDNLRTKLRTNYNVFLTHPDTGNPLEVDRFYPDERIAIEVQGEQHSKEVNFFNGDLEDRIRVDRSKKKQLEAQNILLIEIEYYDTEEMILEKVKSYFMLLDNPRKVEVIKDTYEQYEDPQAAREGLMELVSQYPNELFVSNFVKEKNKPLYTALVLYHGGINGGRNFINIPYLREARDSWTLSKTIEMFKELVEKIGDFPTKKDVIDHIPKLYYAIVKHGGLRTFRKKYYL